MAVDAQLKSQGPAFYQFGGSGGQVGHTMGGITAAYTQNNRPQTVDQFGESPTRFITTGDQIVVTIPFAQWDTETLQFVVSAGDDQLAGSGFIGFGAEAGEILTMQQLDIIPFLTADVDKTVTIWQAAATGDFEIARAFDADTIFSVDYSAVVDEDKDAGQRLGKIGLNSGTTA